MPALSAAQRRVLAEQDARWLELPLPGGDNPAQVAAHIRHLVKLMGGGRRASAAAAAGHWGRLYDSSIQNNFGLACRQGCAHCCVQSVLIYAPEAFAIAAQMRERSETAAAMRGTAERFGMEASGPGPGRQVSCPLLSNNSCSIYEIRPLNCRAFVAVDVRECISTFVMMGKFAVRMPTPITNMRTFWHMLMMAALRLAGKNVAVYEMNAAVSRVLETPDAEARWLAGDDVFEGLAQDLPMAPQIEAEIGRMVTFVAPTMERA
jgi:Fe-S-cluster containining protein